MIIGARPASKTSCTLNNSEGKQHGTYLKNLKNTKSLQTFGLTLTPFDVDYVCMAY